MLFSEMFNLSFLIGIIAVILLVSALCAYINYRFTEQDHKMSSMLGLISTMAQELDFFRNKYNKVGGQPYTDSISNLNSTEATTNNKLIEVSDDDEVDDDDDDDDDDDEDDEEDEEDDDDEDDEDDEPEDGINISLKALNINLGDSNLDISQDIDELSNDNNSISTKANIKTVFLEDDDLPGSQEQEQLHFLKSIHLTDLATSKEEIHTDYKKLPINKLRLIAVEKGLCADSSKMKKNEILKLIES